MLHEPEYNCERHSPLGYWDYIPANKSLFTNGRGYGVAIGNLFSQLFANYLLNVLDWFLLEDLGFTYVGRYVDDFYVVDTDKAKMLDAVPKIRALLAGYGLTLHPDKFYMQIWKSSSIHRTNGFKVVRVSRHVILLKTD